jgi:triphosphoribosyl-dephospho-CoA synthase
MAIQPHEPPLTLGACASLACIWEATAPKPGNVYRGCDFDDLCYADFLTSAAVIAPVIDRADQLGIGGTVLAGVTATRGAVDTNTNLGILLLLAPLAVVARKQLPTLLDQLTVDDTRQVYAAIRLARPGGLGDAPIGDVNAENVPLLPLQEAMRLAADRDLVARQYVNDFAEVIKTAERIARAAESRPISDAIVQGYLELLAEHPDTLVARKCGGAVAQEVTARASKTLSSRAGGDDAYRGALAEFDFWLRADGHRRNPGTSADIVAAALFLLLREQRIRWPVRFY